MTNPELFERVRELRQRGRTPKPVERRKLPGFTDWYFRSYDQPPLAVPIDLARRLREIGAW